LIAISVDFGDIDGDFDVDILHGEKFKVPRIFRNRTEETGAAHRGDHSRLASVERRRQRGPERQQPGILKRTRRPCRSLGAGSV
jgi:hypothetical protein